MASLAELPVWGQWSIFGILISVIALVVVLILKGELVSRKQLDAVQKTADSWQKAWETLVQAQASSTIVLEKVKTLSDTLEHVLTSLPVPKQGEKDEDK